MSILIKKDDVGDGEGVITCNLPLPESDVNVNQCRCWFLDINMTTKDTELGMGCNSLQFESLVNTTLPKCR